MESCSYGSRIPRLRLTARTGTGLSSNPRARSAPRPPNTNLRPRRRQLQAGTGSAGSGSRAPTQRRALRRVTGPCVLPGHRRRHRPPSISTPRDALRVTEAARRCRSYVSAGLTRSTPTAGGCHQQLVAGDPTRAALGHQPGGRSAGQRSVGAAGSGEGRPARPGATAGQSPLRPPPAS